MNAPTPIPLKLMLRRERRKAHPLILVSEESGRPLAMQQRIEILEPVNGRYMVRVTFLDVRDALAEEYEG